MNPSYVALLLFILPFCMGLSPSQPTLTSGPSEPRLTLHEAALTASCVTSLVATSLSCWTVTAINKALAVQTPAPNMHPDAATSDVGKREEPEPRKFISCEQLYATSSSCAIGVHPQPSFEGYPTAVVITTTLSADAAPMTSTLAMSAAMSVGILDATLINPAGDTWDVTWTDEVRDRIVVIANDYCGLPGKAKRQFEGEQDGAGAMVPRDLDRITCNMRNLEAGQQQAFQAQVTQEVFETAAAELPVAAVEAFASTGLTTLQIQRAAAAVVGLGITAAVIAGVELIGTSGSVKKEDVLGNVPKVIASMTPSPTSTESSSSSSSSSSTTQICPLCTACAPIKLNDDEGQIGASIPTRPGAPAVSITATRTYSCHSAAHEIETVTFNRGPWCDCPDGQFSTSESVITSGTETITDICAYTTPAPASLSWYPRAYNLRSVACDAQHGDKYGMVREDYLANVVSYCSSASAQSFNHLASATPATRTDKNYKKGASRLSELSKPTHKAFAVYGQKFLEQWPMDVPKREKMKMAFQVKYDVEACDDPRNPTLVDFVVTDWCNIQFQPIWDYHQCAYTYHIMDRVRSSLFYSGGKVYSDCMSWEIFMVGRNLKRMSDILADKERKAGGGKFYDNSTVIGVGSSMNSTGEGNSTGWDSMGEEWDSMEEGSSDGWSETVYFPGEYWGSSDGED